MTPEQELAHLRAQLAFLTFRISRAEMVIDELKNHVSADTFDTIWKKAEGKILSRDQVAVQKMQNILLEIDLVLSPQQKAELLSQWSSKGK